MKNKKALIIVGIAGAVIVLAALAFVALGIGNARGNKDSLLSEYFRALSAQNAQRVEELTTDAFVSDLPLDGLSPRSYRLYVMEGGSETAKRFAIVIARPDGSELLLLADASFVTKGLVSYIDSIRLAQRGNRIRE